MTDQTDRQKAPEDKNSGAANHGSESVIDDVKTLVDDGVTYAHAEFAFQRSRLAYAGRHAKWIAIFSILAAVLIILGIFAVVFGAILALAPHFTPAGATAIVVGVLIASAFLLAIIARAKVRKLLSVFRDDDR